MAYAGFPPSASPLSAVQMGAGDARFPRLDGANVSPSIFRNALINGSFDHWQRATSAALSTTGFSAYIAADRWNVLSNAQGGTFSRLSFPYPGTEIGRSDSRYYARIELPFATSAAADIVQLRHHVEGVHTLAGKRVLLRGYARRWAGSGNIMATLTQNFGASGSAAAPQPWKAVALSPTWAPFVIPFDLQSLAGKVIGPNGDDYLAVVFVLSAGSNFSGTSLANGQLGLQAITVDFADLELVEAGAGDQAGSARVPRDIELIRCRRFFQRIYDPVLRGIVTSPTRVARCGMMLRDELRVSPTCTLGGVLKIFDGTSVWTVANTVQAITYGKSIELDFDLQAGSTATANRPALQVVDGSQLAWIDLNAEL